MPCPHCKITIIKRSNNESTVSAAAYQSGEKLFSEYDQAQKYCPYKTEVTHKEIMLPPHAPPEFADRNTLWNSAEAQEKQWNSQLARRFVLAIPREIPPEQYADLLRDYCREFFVSKGMIADFAIHDKRDGNPHSHILLTMRAMDEKGRWLPKSRKVYDIDGNGERIRLPSGRWKLPGSLPSHKAGKDISKKVHSSYVLKAQKGQREAMECTLAKDGERIDVLEKMVLRLYEDMVAGRITEENFNLLLEKTQKEQAELKAKVEEGRKRLADEIRLAVDARQWVESIQEYKDITELDASTLNRLIKKIVVHETIGSDKTRHISIEIHFNLKPIPEVEQVTG